MSSIQKKNPLHWRGLNSISQNNGLEINAKLRQQGIRFITQHRHIDRKSVV